MATRQYIGARYVIKVYENTVTAGSAEWEADTTYEPLTLVTYNNSSYLSKKAVPATVGNPPSNTDYWVETGAYNGQIASLQNQIGSLANLNTTDKTNLVNAINEVNNKYLVINVKNLPPEWGLTNLAGDNLTDDTQALKDVITYIDTLADGQGYRRKLYFPTGKYVLSDTITIPQYLDICGEGALSTGFFTDLQDAPLFELTSHNVIQDCNIQHKTQGNNTALLLKGMQSEIYRVRIYNFTVGIEQDNASGIKAEQVYIQSNVNNFKGVTFKDRCVSSKYFKVTIVATSGVTGSVGFNYVSGNYCMDLHFLMCESSGLTNAYIFNGETTAYPGDITIIDGAYDAMKSDFVDVTGFNSDGNLLIANNWVNYSALSANAIAIDIHNSNNISIVNNRIESLNSGGTTYLRGISIANSSKNITIQGNSFNNLFAALVGANSDNITCVDNILSSNDATQGTCFMSVNTVSYSSIINNKQNGTVPYKYDFTASALTYSIIKNNIFEADTHVPYSDTSCIIDDNIMY